MRPVKGYFASKYRVWTNVRKYTYRGRVCGLGKVGIEEQHKMGKEVLGYISMFLKNKPYLMGDRMSSVDCVLFAYLVRVLYGAPSSCVYAKIIKDNFHNLIPYMNKIKADLWP